MTQTMTQATPQAMTQAANTKPAARKAQAQRPDMLDLDAAGSRAAMRDRSEKTNSDFVTEIFDLLTQMHPDLESERLELERAVRVHFGGSKRYIAARPDPGTTAARVLALFNGRNARTVARVLGISRMQVYRHLKQPGQKK